MYPQALVGWLVNVLEAVDYHYTPLDVLQTEYAYPGLWDDIGIERWQRALIKRDLEEKNSGNG